MSVSFSLSFSVSVYRVLLMFPISARISGGRHPRKLHMMVLQMEGLVLAETPTTLLLPNLRISNRGSKAEFGRPINHRGEQRGWSWMKSGESNRDWY